jgi:hypothetical protein
MTYRITTAIFTNGHNFIGMIEVLAPVKELNIAKATSIPAHANTTTFLSNP